MIRSAIASLGLAAFLVAPAGAAYYQSLDRAVLQKAKDDLTEQQESKPIRAELARAQCQRVQDLINRLDAGEYVSEDEVNSVLTQAPF